jgi:hypothetical protein
LSNTELEWETKLKGYPHFDAPISKTAAIELVSNPAEVSSHKFLPFLSYVSVTKKFGIKKPKERLIRYGARKDAYIYSYYRKILLDRYDIILKEKGLDECVIAYRQVKIPGSDNGKSNINFAKEAFAEITRQGSCVAIAVDISGFFESLNHQMIKQKWKLVLGVQNLPADHYNVYRNITDYRVVDLDECYQTLGLAWFEGSGNSKIKKYKYTRKEQVKYHQQLCKPAEFREKIAGYGEGYKSIIQGNPYKAKGNNCGIPQGSPISDIIANMYMLDFDEEIKSLADETVGYYRRYSDDILFICPPDKKIADLAISKIKAAISKLSLKIKDEKTIITHFFCENNETTYKSYDGLGNAKGNAFEYLGFSFDGKRILLKSQTLTRYYKKVNGGIKAAVKTASLEAKKNGITDPRPYLDIPALYHKYSNANRKWKGRDGEKARNFITYVKRSENLMPDQGIRRQLRNHRKYIKDLIEKEIAKY